MNVTPPWQDVLRGELDPVTGAKVRKRFLQEAERLRRQDLHNPGGEKRNLNQRMADALETLSSRGSIYSQVGGGRTGVAGTGTNETDGDSRGAVGGAEKANKCGCGGRRALADITIVQHLSADGTEAFAEIAGGAVIPPSVLEEHFCNAAIKGVVLACSCRGRPSTLTRLSSVSARPSRSSG